MAEREKKSYYSAGTLDQDEIVQNWILQEKEKEKKVHV